MDNCNDDIKEDVRINKCNLELLVNPLYQKCIVKPENDNKIKNCKSDLKFYRKRILSLTNDYLKGKYEQCGAVNEALKQLHNEYVYNVIQYLKMTDKVDTIQNEYNIDISCADITSTSCSPTSSISCTPTPTSTPNNCDQSKHSQDVYNSQLILKQVNTNTLDSYIKRTKRVVKSPIKLPINKVIDYHSPEFKTKGIKEKII